MTCITIHLRLRLSRTPLFPPPLHPHTHPPPSERWTTIWRYLEDVVVPDLWPFLQAAMDARQKAYLQDDQARFTLFVPLYGEQAGGSGGRGRRRRRGRKGWRVGPTIWSHFVKN